MVIDARLARTTRALATSDFSIRRCALVAAAALSLLAVCLIGAASARASTVLSENWESGLDGWSAADTSSTVDAADPTWQVLTNPQNISVANPGINPTLVTLPDSGSLPTAHGGSNAAWFGDTTSGTFCGADWAEFNVDASKNGCTSREAFSGTLTSPSFSLADQTSATLHFFSWWEIEGVEADGFDTMAVQYSTDGGEDWSQPVTLNPSSSSGGQADQSYSNNGLEVSPTWHEYFVDLSQAAGQPDVRVRFLFDTGDTQYNGFRGWLIDDISVNAPADVAAPTISSVVTCSGTESAPITIINGSNFVQGSQAIVDGSPVTTSVVSSDRIEIDPLGSGPHSVQVQSPDGTTSNTQQFTAGSCAAPSVSGLSPASGPSAGGTVVTITGANFTGTTEVKFGSTPATFTFISDTALTAKAPGGTGTVDVAVTTGAGTSSIGPSDKFAYIPPPPPPTPKTKPGVQSTASTSSTSSAARFSAAVGPGGLSTTAHFEYGLDSRYTKTGTSGPVYDQSTPNQSIGSDFADHPVTASVTGLVPNALYHMRLVATNSAGTTFGPDVTFTTPKGPAPAPPTLGKSFTGSATGLVLIEVNGHFVPITELSKITNGAVINALHGTLTLNTAASGTQHATIAANKGKTKKPKKPKTQTGKFGGAVFKITQAHSGLATLSLVEGAKFKGAPSYASCQSKSGKAVIAKLSKKTLQLLRGSGHGKFRTKGRYAAATIRGTIWTTADRCDGTVIHAIKDTVTVNDLVLHKTITLRPGHSYLAQAHPPKVKKKKTHK